MIEGDCNDETLKAIVQVVGSACRFAICGSRFFGDVHDTSDYDFVTEDDLAEKLIEAGWVYSRSDQAGYLDSNTKHVIQRGMTQVIIVHSIPSRMKAREYIIANKLNRHLTDSWEEAYKNQ